LTQVVLVRVRRYALLLTVLLVSLFLLTVQTRGGGPTRAADLVGLVVTPAQSLLAGAHRGALAAWHTFTDWKAVRTENLALRADNERLRVQSLQVRETDQENHRLRRLLVLRDRMPLTTLTGEIIGREGGGWARSLTVNRGRADGVAQQMPVIVPEGLVGRVALVRSGASVVQLLNDPTSTVGAVVQRTRTAGLVEGEPGGGVRFKFMARDGAGVTPGDLIVTSGLGTLFPKGIPVGRVTAIEDKGSALFHFAVLAPAVDFARVEEVLLLTGQSAQDFAGLFTPGG
jgi:rod shape-determining protein MreC